MLSVQNLHVSFSGSLILRGVNIEVPPNKVVCLMGRNGVGKSTTLRTIMGLHPAVEGRVVFDGRDVTGLRTDRIARMGIGYVPQGRDIFPLLTVRENLDLAVVGCGRKNPATIERVLALFPVLRDMMRRKGGVLSGGQQQQLAIARALLTEPKLLVLDEPTEGIQPSIIDEIGETLQKLKKDGNMAILLVEQCVSFAQALADYFYIMQKGTIVASGPMSDLDDRVVKQHLTV